MATILIVDDEENIASFLRLELEHEGFATKTAYTGREALQLFNEQPFDLVLLDVMLPELNGIEVLKTIRKTSSVPIIMLSARGETFDKVFGLDTGADDYLAKPFEIDELLARIRAILRRSQNNSSQEKNDGNIITFKDLKVDTYRMEVFIKETLLTLTKTEFMVLLCLLKHKNHVMTRDAIITEVWGENHYIDDNSVDVYIRYLRSKIDDFAQETYISTVRGMGYMIKD